jgi:putative oxidoreductase
MSASTSNFPAQSQRTSVSLDAAGPIVFLGRLLFALIFLMSGPMHFSGQMIGYAASQGVPLASLTVPFSGLLAIVGGLSIVLGYRARIGAWLIAVFLVGVTPLHNFWAVTDPTMHQMQFILFMKNVAMLGGALLISQLGSGPWSLDARKR